jgi:predicted nuclease of predicted toxin-antitoxin system
VKLLFDENLSPRLIELLADGFPGSTQIERLNMRGATDAAIWAYARDHGFTIVSKDNDFGSMHSSTGLRRRYCGFPSAMHEPKP